MGLKEIHRRAQINGEDIQKHWLQSIPMGRFQSGKSVADAVAFLTSAAADEITGEALNVSGGMVMN